MNIDMSNAFNLVSHKALGVMVSTLLCGAISTDDVCPSLLFHRWYIDDGVVAGPSMLQRRPSSMYHLSST